MHWLAYDGPRQPRQGTGIVPVTMAAIVLARASQATQANWANWANLQRASRLCSVLLLCCVMLSALRPRSGPWSQRRSLRGAYTYTEL